MQAMRTWFLKGATFEHLFKRLTPYTGVLIILASIGSYVASLWVAEDLSSNTITPNNVAWLIKAMGGIPALVFEVSILGPLREEFLWRLIPLGTLGFLFYQYGWLLNPRWKDGVMISALAITTVSFGFMHGGLGNILIQGWAGLLLGVVFLRWSHYGTRVLKGYAACCLLHIALNGFGLLSTLSRYVFV